MFMWLCSLGSGLEEDFKVWKEGFVRQVFPVLLGEKSIEDIHTPGKERIHKCENKSKKAYSTMEPNPEEVM